MIPDRNEYPSVSVIVPVYNGEATIQELLDSLSHLEYPLERIEIIIVDNNSTDHSIDITKRYPVTILREKYIQSSYAARNCGTEIARGDFLAFTDADCIVTSSWLSKLLDHHQDETIGIFAGEIRSYSQSSLIERFGEMEGILDQKRFLKYEYMPYAVTANMVVRKELFKKIGGFNASLTSGGDADFCWRLQKETSSRIEYVPDAIVFHKHRHSVRSLYQQFRKYGRGVYYLQKLHPEAYPLVSTYWWWKDAQTHFGEGARKLCERFRGTSKQDSPDWTFSFLRALCFFGLAMGRVDAILNERYRKGSKHVV